MFLCVNSLSIKSVTVLQISVTILQISIKNMCEYFVVNILLKICVFYFFHVFTSVC